MTILSPLPRRTTACMSAIAAGLLDYSRLFGTTSESLYIRDWIPGGRKPVCASHASQVLWEGVSFYYRIREGCLGAGAAETARNLLVAGLDSVLVSPSCTSAARLTTAYLLVLAMRVSRWVTPERH